MFKHFCFKKLSYSEAVAQRCFVKKVFLEFSQNSHENTGARDSFLIELQTKALTQVFSCEFCKISKKNFFYRIPPVAASAYCHQLIACIQPGVVLKLLLFFLKI